MCNSYTQRMWRAIFTLVTECNTFGENSIDAKYIYKASRKCGVSFSKLTYEWSLQLRDLHKFGMFVDLI